MPISFLPPHALYLSVDLRRRRIVDPFLRRAAIRSALFYILHSRGTFPQSAEEILEFYTKERSGADAGSSVREEDSAGAGFRSRRRRRTTRAERKLLKAGGDLAALCDDLDAVFGALSSCGSIASALITLGPSFASPREQYVIRFRDSGDDADAPDPSPPRRSPLSGDGEMAMGTANTAPEAITTDDAEAVRERLGREISRRCVREMMQGTLSPEYIDMFATPSGRGGGGAGGTSAARKVNVALLLKRRDFEGAVRASESLMSVERYGAEGEHLNALEGGDPKRGLPPSDPPTLNIGRVPLQEITSDGIYCSRQITPVVPLSRRLVVRRNFEICTPRPISRKKNLQRPFVVLDIVAAGCQSQSSTIPHNGTNSNPAAETGEQSKDEAHGRGTQRLFSADDGHVWVSLRSSVREFRL